MPPHPIADGTVRVLDVVLLDLNTTASRLSLSPRSVRRLVHDGELASILHGGRRMFDEVEIADYLRRALAASAKQRAARGRARRSATRAAG